MQVTPHIISIDPKPLIARNAMLCTNVVVRADRYRAIMFCNFDILSLFYVLVKSRNL
jgi:hypothetical protein